MDLSDRDIKADIIKRFGSPADIEFFESTAHYFIPHDENKQDLPPIALKLKPSN